MFFTDIMTYFKYFCLFFLLGAARASFDNTPEWVSSYSVEGDIIIPLAEVQESFVARYDLVSGNSVIDFHNGMTKTYQISKTGNFGMAYKVVSANTKNRIKTMKCFQVNGNERFPILVQSVLPDLRDYKFVSNHFENGKIVEKWTSTIIKEKSVKNFEMLLYRLDNVIYPLRYDVNGIDLLFGKNFDDYFIVYKNFSPVKPDPHIFNIRDEHLTLGLKCESSSGPRVDHVYNFNPMMEFINNYEKHIDFAFEEFKRQHNRTYIISTPEHFKRKNKFRQNLRFINSKNRANLGYVLAVNHLADYYDEELKLLGGCKNVKRKQHARKTFHYINSSFNDLPDNVDWRTVDAVTPVQDQGLACASSWSFSVTGNMEGAYFIKHRMLKKFSDQYLVDCSWSHGNFGCDGGDNLGAYLLMEEYGIPTEAMYGPYLGENSICRFTTMTRNDLIKISGYYDVPTHDVQALKIALIQKGPIAISVYSRQRSFLFYSSGVYYDRDCLNDQSELTQAVLLVGYGNRNGEPFWLVKNSWSNTWGINGYILISRKDNMCGVLSEPTFVEVL